MNQNDPTARAIAAYFTACAHTGDVYQQPSNLSGEAELDGRRYVILRTSDDILAVYRIRTDGILKRLIRWPKAITE